MNAIRLKTEHLFNPLGIDVEHPLLMWNCEGSVRQTAYQVVAGAWDSGKVGSGAMFATYPLELRDGERIEWKVRLWDEDDEVGDWSGAFFEMGISTWKASWICGNYVVDKDVRYPIDCFRKVFAVGERVERARLYITACGLYEARIGGEKVGCFCLAPGYTDYRTRVQYQTYDVTHMLREGSNELTVQLADGWFRGSCGAWGLKNQYGTETKLLAQLEIRYEDGTAQVVVSDGSWAWSNDGPIRFADNKDGEVVDARQTPCYGGKAKVTAHGVTPSASNNVPVREHERFTPTLITTPSGSKVLDFGQNIQGYVEFSVTAHEGERLFLRFGEMLDSDGEFTQRNFQLSNKKMTTPLQQVEYLCHEGENSYKTTFSVFGFRYVLVETDADFSPEGFTAIAVYSDFERTGWFESSNELLNGLFEATVWSAKGNHLDIPTDCPTRERHGWTGDAQLFAKTASYLFDFATFAQKYENDLKDAQLRNGCFTQIVPVGGVDSYMNPMNGSAGWSDAGVLIPWTMYSQYGDLRVLEENYDAMRAYAEYKSGTLGAWYPTALPTGLGLKDGRDISNYGQSYGEWAEPVDVNAFSVADFISPHPEETTAYIVYLMDVMAQIAQALGRNDDARRYSDVAARARRGYQKLVSTKKFSLDTDRQAKLVRPLFFDLLDDGQKDYAEKRLIAALEQYGWRLGTGFLSTPLILYVLADLGIEYAYRLLENEEIPGWLAMPKAGATTIWESWEGPYKSDGGTDSLNHYSKGAVCEWLFTIMCGIQADGPNRFVIAPRPGGSFTHAKARWISASGLVESGWERRGDRCIYAITVPANCQAEVRLPDGACTTVGAGEHRFEGVFAEAGGREVISGQDIPAYHFVTGASTKNVDVDNSQSLKDILRINRYRLDDRFVIRDGKTHPFAVVCPGGGYGMVCSFIEGTPIARRLNALGISVFIVYYRVRSKARYPHPQDDLARAVREVLDRAEEYCINPEGYSVWGSSAGGHLAASFGTEEMGYTRYNLPKPAAIVLSYPVISMNLSLTHGDTHNNLLGKDAASDAEAATSVERHVSADYPPTFIWCGDADATVDPKNTQLMAEALESAGVPYRCVVFPGVDHGVGPGTGTAAEGWIDQAVEFWRTQSS